MKASEFGTIRVQKIRNEFYRLTLQIEDNHYLNELESQGVTLAEALIGLHEVVEEFER
jgi:hypothetical protein